ncbi:MAG: hypothetical protein ABIH67_01215 [Candidatus Uhrbacteria bacterium]
MAEEQTTNKDIQFTELVKLLEEKQILSPEEAERLLALNPFPQQA